MTELPWVEVVVVIGSLASDRGDGVSDVDRLVGVHDRAFDAAWRVLAGDPRTADRWPARPPIAREELTGGAHGLHPVEVAYDDFNARLRAAT